ncbi:hypothetical protein J2128_002060 [Methanomicrobium sp. W14]|uniref:hypothetical protein n=1 Tax=Methanomicrobium sp. W14 TaxID=2817839 RepID=UPI001AE8A9B8|nr:hypothetical protein [Methanomicrobium sp. W14]MBP2134094.1 hypothetical protein [Methanomicrobium sp. W14]
MTDFIETGSSKSAVRNLEKPVEDIASFDAMISRIVSENPFECTDYSYGGEDFLGITRNREYYTAKINFEDDNAKVTGSVSVKAPSVNSFGSAAEKIVSDTELAGTIGADPVRDSSKDAYYCQLKCHDANGETYYVTFTRSKVRVSSYEDDAIMARIENWADTVDILS